MEPVDWYVTWSPSSRNLICVGRESTEDLYSLRLCETHFLISKRKLIHLIPQLFLPACSYKSFLNNKLSRLVRLV